MDTKTMLHRIEMLAGGVGPAASRLNVTPRTLLNWKSKKRRIMAGARINIIIKDVYQKLCEEQRVKFLDEEDMECK